MTDFQQSIGIGSGFNDLLSYSAAQWADTVRNCEYSWPPADIGGATIFLIMSFHD